MKAEEIHTIVDPGLSKGDLITLDDGRYHQWYWRTWIWVVRKVFRRSGYKQPPVYTITEATTTTTLTIGPVLDTTPPTGSSWTDIGSCGPGRMESDDDYDRNECRSRPVGNVADLTPAQRDRMKRMADESIWFDVNGESGVTIKLSGEPEWIVEVHGPPYPPGTRG